MAYEIPGFRMTLPAVAALATDIALLVAAGTTHVPRFVSVDSSGTIDYTAASSINSDSANACEGVLQDDPRVALEPASIMVTGVSKLEAGGTVTAGLRVVATGTTTGAGKATNVTASGDNQIALGIALETVSSGEFFACLLMTPGGNRDALA